MPNSSNNLVLKLISIGMSHDLSRLEQLKYGSNEGYEGREEDFKLTYRRMFLALITLGCIIKNYSLRRVCFQCASVCEAETNFCGEILKYLPANEDKADEDDLDADHLNIRYQLEIFQYEIKDRTKLPNSFDKSSNVVFETLEYFNHRVTLDEELLPLEYPGVEKYLKKQAIEEKEHVSQTADLDKCLKDIDEFNADLSHLFKKLSIPLPPIRKQKLPTHEEILTKLKEILSASSKFKITKTGEIIGELVSLNFSDLLTPNVHWNAMNELQSESNQDNLYFDFNANDDEKCDDEDTNTDDEIDLIYQRGTVEVKKLFTRGHCTYEIENIMLYAIMEKKMKFISEEFTYLNKNRNVETDKEQNQVYAGLLYVSNRPHPEYARLMRLTSTMMRFSNLMEYLLEAYDMEVTPGKFKYISRQKAAKIKLEPIDYVESMISDQDTSINNDDSMELSLSKHSRVEEPSAVAIKKETNGQSTKKVNGRKEKLPPSIVLAGTETFNVSSEIQNVFETLKREMSEMIEKEVLFDMGKICDTASPNIVQCTSANPSVTNSTVPIKVQRIRNSHLDPREFIREVQLPSNVSGKVCIFKEIRDEIAYDEHFDNPQIKSTVLHRISSTVTIDNLTHSVKFDLDCSIENFVSKMRFVFQGTKNARPRKKPAKKTVSPENPPTVNDASNGTSIKTEPGQVSVIQSLSNTHFTTQSNSNNDNTTQTTKTASNNVITNNSSIILPSPSDSQTNVFVTPSVTAQQSFLPPFGSIGSSHYDNSLNQFQQPTTTSIPSQYPMIVSSSQSNETSNNPGYALAASIHSRASCNDNVNGVDYQQHSMLINQSNQPFVTEYEEVQMQQEQNIFISPNRVQPKVEILKVENVNVNKLSFANPTIMVKVKEEVPNGNTQMNNSMAISIKNELVDFEEEIGQSAIIPKKPMNIPVALDTLPKFMAASPPPLHYHLSNFDLMNVKQETFEDAFQEEPVIMPRKEPMKFFANDKIIIPKIESIQILPAEKVQSPIKESFSLPKCELPIVQQIVQKPDKEIKTKLFKNPFASIDEPPTNNLKKHNNSTELNGKKNNNKCESDVIDLTEDNFESTIDLTAFNPSHRNKPRPLRHKRQGEVLDITFVSCANASTSSSADYMPTISLDSTLKNELSISAQRRSENKKMKRSLSPYSNSNYTVKDCKVRLVDVMKNWDQKSCLLKKETKIRLEPVYLENLPMVKKYKYR